MTDETNFDEPQPDESETEPGSATLSEALDKAELNFPPEVVANLERYARTVWSWNEKLNLTRHTTWDKFVSRDVVDSMALENFLDAGERVLDVGTGGGVPGIILAIIRPDLEVSLCDSMAKKARAVTEIVTELGLNIPVLHGPVQAVLQEHEFDTLVCRAVAPITKLLFWLKPCWDQFQQVLLIKGPAWKEELAVARQKQQTKFVRVEEVASYPLAGTDSHSYVLQLRRM